MPAQNRTRLYRDMVLLLMALSLGMILLQRKLQDTSGTAPDGLPATEEATTTDPESRVSRLGSLTGGTDDKAGIQAPPKFDPNRQGPIEPTAEIDETLDPINAMSNFMAEVESPLPEEDDTADIPALTVDETVLASVEAYHEALATYIDAAMNELDPNRPPVGFSSMVDTIMSAMAEEQLPVPESGISLLRADGTLLGDLGTDGSWDLYNMANPAPENLLPIPPALNQASGSSEQDFTTEEGSLYLVTTVYTYVPSMDAYLLSSILTAE